MLSKEDAARQLKVFAAPADGDGTPSEPKRGLLARLRSDPLADQLRVAVSADALAANAVDASALAAGLDALDSERLTRLFTEVAPMLGAPLARWWVWAQSAPYQSGYSRRGFRSSSPVASYGARVQALRGIVALARQWPQDVTWFAQWLSHLDWWRTQPLAGLLASEIDADEAAVADTLVASAYSQHPISGITRTGVAALLSCADPQRWESVATLLANAGRAEGLRAAVVEAADVAHPDAFARILKVVVADNLTRFAGTARAVGVWFGEAVDVRTPQLAATVARLQELTAAGPPGRDAVAHAAAACVASGQALETFLQLWVLALRDARLAVAAGALLLNGDGAAGSAEVRRGAARLLAELGLTAARDALRGCLDDEDLAVYATALSAWPAHPDARDSDATMDDATIGILLCRVASLGRAREVESGVLGLRPVKVSAAQAADVVLAHRGWVAAPAAALAAASADGRYSAVRVLAKDAAANRAALFGFLTDASSTVRGQAITAVLTLERLSAGEVALLEESLRRKASDIRQAAVTLLARQPREQLAATVGRLAAGTPEQARAADELAVSAGLAVSGSGGGQRPGSGAGGPEETRVAVQPSWAFPAELVPAVADRTPAVSPELGDLARWQPYHAGARRAVTSLRAWLSEHSDTEVTTPGGVELLMNVKWLPAAPPGSALPLPELTGPWWERTHPQLSDGGVEVLLVALAIPSVRPGVPATWAHEASSRVLGDIPGAKPEVPLLWQVLRAVATAEFRPDWIDVALDAAETVRAGTPVSGMLGPTAAMAARGRTIERSQYGHVIGADARDTFADPARVLPLASLSAGQLGRLWRLARYVDEPEGTLDLVGGATVEYVPYRWGSTPATPVRVFDQPWRRRPHAELLMRAAAAVQATPGDVLEALMAFDNIDQVRSEQGRHAVQVLPQLSRRRPLAWASTPEHPARTDELAGTDGPANGGGPAGAGHPAATAAVDVPALVDRVRAVAVAGELARGDLPGPLTSYARALRSVTGIDTTAALLSALGKRPFTRGYAWTDSRESSLSHLIRVAFPAPGEHAEQLSAALTAVKVPQRRAVEFGVYAPQWAAMVEAHLGWDGFESAVWWVHAHTNDNSWSVDADIREEWTSAVAQRTPLDAVDLTRGAADVAWHSDVLATLGEDRFAQVLAAAKYASSSGGHKRAVLYADALAGRVDEDALIERIVSKRNQDSVRALGLLPVPGRTDPVVVARYELLAGFVASDKSSGSARRASESTAAAIGMENLARAAGFSDPARLTWAMEAAAVADLAAGPVTATDGTVDVTLSLDEAGAPQLAVSKNGRTLKSVPAAAGKHPDIAGLKLRVTQLRAQAKRMRVSLERSCVSGERFTVEEILELLAHPVLAPMLRALVLVSDEVLVGFPAVTPPEASADAPGGRGAAARAQLWLIDAAGVPQPVDGSRLVIAHPVDLLASGQWPALQRAAFTQRLTQPFRQLFRELYLPTETESSGIDGPGSRRWAGQQVEARRAGAVFTARGWVSDFEVGFGHTFHAEKLTAWCSLQGAWGTPGEAEDATVADVTFTPAGRWEPVPLAQVPPRLFSETMRDLDLVVSVAHASGVDPESSESSVEMRARLVAETADMLSLANVEVTDRHALVTGKLGKYSVHLGSGQVHRLPGNAVCIIPISGQHRGRVFLPFAEDDPRTAEVVSKVLLLARDDKISDPTILEQLA